MRPLASVLAAVLATITILALSPTRGFAQSDEDAGEAIGPDSIGPISGAMNRRWDIEPDGALRLPSQQTVDRAFALFVNGRPVQAAFDQARLLGGGPPAQVWRRREAEFLFGPVTLSRRGPLAGLRVRRRVSLAPGRLWLRFIEEVENRGKTPLRVSLSLRSRVRDLEALRGPTADQEPEPGVWAGGWLRSGASSPFARVYRRRLDRRFPLAIERQKEWVVERFGPLDLAPGQRLAVIHCVAQVDDAKALSAALSGFDPRAVIADLPAAVRERLANFSGGLVLAGLRLEREARADVLVLREGGRLRGRLLTEEVEVETAAGPRRVSREDLLGLTCQRGGRARVGCADQQILVGALRLASFAFQIEGGARLEVPASRVRSLGLSTRSDDARAPKASPAAFLHLRDGSIFAVAELAEPLKARAAFGLLSLGLEDLVGVDLAEPGNWGHRVQLRDGSRFGALIEGPELAVKLVGGEGGAVFRVSLMEVERLTAPRRPAAAPSLGAFDWTLRNGDRLSAPLKEARLKLDTDFGALEVDPRTIARLRAGPAGGFELELWTGSALAGRPAERRLTLVIAGREASIPAALIARARQGSPRLPRALEDKVLAWIGRLEAMKLEERRLAASLLEVAGAYARPYLERALAKDPGPELAQRLRELLVRMPRRLPRGPVDLAGLAERLAKAEAQSKERGFLAARTLEGIWRAQRLFLAEDRDGDGEADFGDLAELVATVGALEDLDKALLDEGRYGYRFSVGPSTEASRRGAAWWGLAVPSSGKGRRFFVNQTGSVFASDGPLEKSLDRGRCDPPVGARRYLDRSKDGSER